MAVFLRGRQLYVRENPHPRRTSKQKRVFGDRFALNPGPLLHGTGLFIWLSALGSFGSDSTRVSAIRSVRLGCSPNPIPLVRFATYLPGCTLLHHPGYTESQGRWSPSLRPNIVF